MYNLFVSGNEDAWEGEVFEMESSRILEHTTEEMRLRFGSLGASQLSELQASPCVFAYEKYCDKNPKFGKLNSVKIRLGKVRIDYEIFELSPFLVPADFERLQFELEISGKFEMNRTHWAVKDVDLRSELLPHGIIIPDINSRVKAFNIGTHHFDIALSFPGELREQVESVAKELKKQVKPQTVFYDNDYIPHLARPSLDSLLQDIYGKRSKLIVVFLSADYERKNWCGVEFRAIREILFDQKFHKIMYFKMDNSDLRSVFKTDGFVDGCKLSPHQIADFILERARQDN